jgi:hypothetical protein
MYDLHPDGEDELELPYDTPDDRKLWDEELNAVSLVRERLFEIAITDRRRYRHYMKAYTLLSQVSEILEKVTIENAKKH